MLPGGPSLLLLPPPRSLETSTPSRPSTANPTAARSEIPTEGPTVNPTDRATGTPRSSRRIRTTATNRRTPAMDTVRRTIAARPLVSQVEASASHSVPATDHDSVRAAAVAAPVTDTKRL